MRLQGLRIAAIAISIAAIGCGADDVDAPERAPTPSAGTGPAAESTAAPAGDPRSAAPATSPDAGAEATAGAPLQSRPEVSRYLAELNAACAADRGSRRLFEPPAGAGLAMLVRYARRTLPRVQRRYDRLARRKPPESFREPMQSVLMAYQSYTSLLQQLATQEGEGASAPLVEQLRPSAERVRSQAAVTGLPACA